MIDELEILRSLRPEVVGPSDELTTRERQALMTVIDQERPRTATAERHRDARGTTRRPRARLAAALAFALLGAGGAASAAGLIPDDVRQALGIAGDANTPGLRVEAGKAQLRTSAPTADGGTVELWTAPTEGGGQCSYLRHLPAGGGSGGGDAKAAPGIGCSTAPGANASAQPPRGAEIEVRSESSAAGSALYGKVPAAAAKLVVTFDDRTMASTKADRGWFLISVPLPLGGPGGSPAFGDAENRGKTPRSVTAFSSSDEVLATVDLAFRGGAPGDAPRDGGDVNEDHPYASGSTPSGP